jgi:hypothetical protein
MCIVVIFIQNFRFFAFKVQDTQLPAIAEVYTAGAGVIFFLYGTTFQHEVGFSANRLSQKSNMC